MAAAAEPSASEDVSRGAICCGERELDKARRVARVGLARRVVVRRRDCLLDYGCPGRELALRPQRRLLLRDDAPVLESVEAPAHCEDGVSLRPARGGGRQQVAPARKVLANCAHELVTGYLSDQCLGRRPEKRNAVLAHEVVADDPFPPYKSPVERFAGADVGDPARSRLERPQPLPRDVGDLYPVIPLRVLPHELCVKLSDWLQVVLADLERERCEKVEIALLGVEMPGCQRPVPIQPNQPLVEKSAQTETKLAQRFGHFRKAPQDLRVKSRTWCNSSACSSAAQAAVSSRTSCSSWSPRSSRSGASESSDR